MNPSPLVPSSRRPGQEGSAYVVALLVLVVLTIFGLTLTMMTQTEVQIAANERTGNRTFYAAETGLHAAVARLLTGNECQMRIYEFPDELEVPDALIGNRVCAEPIVPTTAAPCSLCQINQGERYLRANHDLAVFAFRAKEPGDPSFDAATAVARRSVCTMLDLSPRRDDVVDQCLQGSGAFNVGGGSAAGNCANGGTAPGSNCVNWGGCEDLG